MKIVSWNVNGIRACVKKGFLEYFQQVNADIFCLQETKLQAGQIELHLEGYEQYWNYAEKKGYSGTAVFTKQKPLSVKYGVGDMMGKRRAEFSPWNMNILFSKCLYAECKTRFNKTSLSIGMGR